MERALILNCSPVRTGATARIAEAISEALEGRFDARRACLDDYRFDFCRGCRSCHATARCVMDDDVTRLMDEFEQADVIVCVSPSYWADVPGQFKAFIDRCTPWCNTHEPHASLSPGFYGHLEIECRGRLGLCGVERREDVDDRLDEIKAFCDQFI